MNLIAIKSNEEIYLNQPPFEKVGKIRVFKDVIQITLNDNFLTDEPQSKRDKKNRKEIQHQIENLNSDNELNHRIENKVGDE